MHRNNCMTRRDFLRTSGGIVGGLSLAALTPLQAKAPDSRPKANACIQLFLVGGPSQLDTWDLKPSAPEEIRGPFRPIRTNVPGIHISEHFPRMARRADRFAILRSVYHKDAPIHETGQQLLQTGRLTTRATEWPHVGAVLGDVRPAARGVPSWYLLPDAIQDTGVQVGNGQTVGFLGWRKLPLIPLPLVQEGLLRGEPTAKRERYGDHPFGQNCLLALRTIGWGTRLVTVNMFDTVFNQVTWDCHANGGDLTSSLRDYPRLCAILDQAFTALLDDLESLGLLETTLVMCMGEFGRTPWVNRNRGRDHWPGCWSILMAGGGVRGGQVIGASDPHGAEPHDRPIHASEIAATVYHAMGIDPRTCLLGPECERVPLVEADPVWELF